MKTSRLFLALALSLVVNGVFATVVLGAGPITEFPVGTRFPGGITTGPDGNLWFSEGVGYIGRITAAGVITEFPLTVAGGGPYAITAGPDGNVWFAVQTGGRIGRITPTGVITEFRLSQPNSFPVGITAGPDGNLWFTESDRIGRPAHR